MASGEQLVDDLFGFAELTGENVATACKTSVASQIADKKAEVAPKFHLEIDQIKRDTDEVIVPILFEKSGVKKYKVLARHQVEDDEDIRRPGSSERSSPNSEEQRKENINIEQSCDNVQNKKLDVKKNIKRQKVKGIENTVGEHSLKKIKKGQNPRKWIDKIKITKGKVKKDKHVESKEKKVTAGTDKDSKAVSYEFHDELDLHLKLHDVKSSVKGISPNEDKIKACDSRAVDIQNSFEFRSSEEKVKHKPLKVECLVKLRRDPSIENFYKTLSDYESAVLNSCNSDISDTAPKEENLGTVINNECNKCLDSDENKTASHPNSSDENRLKMTDMIYNADIKVRKSGRLQSAKCASRYRGDYGIRKDTYKQLVNKTINTSFAKDNSGKTDNKLDERSNCKASDVDTLEKSNCLEQLDYEDTSQTETEISVDESKTLVNRLTIPSEAYTNVSSAAFTVLRDPDVVYSMAESMISKTEACSSKCSLVGKELLDNKDCENQPLIECEEGRNEGTCILQGYSQDSCHGEEYVKQCENERKEVVSNGNEGTKNMKTVHQNDVNRQNADLSTEDNNKKSVIQKCCETCDICSNLTETECTVVPNEVPSQVIKEIESCFPVTLTEKSSCRNEKNDLIDMVVNHEVNQEKSIFTAIRTEVQADTKFMKSVQCEDSIEENDKTLKALQKKSNDINKERSGYVHSVGKSVNKIQKRMEIKKPVSSNMKGSSYPDISPESSPVKDTATVLESLRQKLFESAGADVIEADKVPKQFESKLISSKQRRSTDVTLPLLADLEEKQLRESDPTSVRSGKSSPRCSTPRSEPSTVILEEVAKSLNVLHKAKRKNDTKQKPTKRQRFEEKKFLLRSMKKTTDDEDIETKDTETEVKHSVDISVVAGKIHERRRSSRNSAENNSSCFDSVNAKSSVGTSDIKKQAEKQHILEKPVAKPKPVKCSACSHIFKTKELLRKHFPCRIRQTRTWSQNKLRPNRAVKRAENSSKKFVCKLPKPGKSEASISRPQLLTYRKTKFRKVKGKRRRRLYQLIQDLRQKRMPVKWPHLSVVYDDLSFKEQCLYNLGLICVGNASDGLERYTAEEITIFEQHRAKERWMTEDAQTFKHSIPDSLRSLNDVNVSTEISTDNQESDFCSPKSVINFPQVNIDNISCDNGSTTEETVEGASNEEKLEIESQVKDKLDITDTSCSPSSRTKEMKEREIPWCLSYIQECVEQKDNSYEEVVEFEDTPEIIKANISIQDYANYVRNSDIKGRDNVTPKLNFVADVESISRSQTIQQLKTLTNVRESSIEVETVEEISSIGKTALSVEIDMEQNFLHKVIATEVDVCSTETDYVHEENSSKSSDVISNQDNEKLCIQELSMPGFEIRREFISSSDYWSSSRNEQPISIVFDDSSEMGHDNKLKLNGSGPREDSDQETFSNVSSNEQFSFQKEKQPLVKEVSSSKLEGSKSIPVNIGRITNGIKTKEHTKNFPLKKTLPPAPDIELFHQTATIDEKYLVSNSLTVSERVSEKDLDNIQSCLQEEGTETIDNTSTRKAESHQNIIRQASGMPEDILEDVEQTVTSIESKCMPSTTATRFKDVSASSDVTFLKGLNVNTSPVKGILKSVSPKEKFTPLSAPQPVMSQDRKDSFTENSLKSPAKKKIDFKTYAKRKGMLKDKDEDREYMRSESHEIEDGLLNRLLDAVNVIDSIIEEHRDHIEPADDTFSAITPEMAFEAAMLRNKMENPDEEESSKLYDIESIYTSYEGENFMDVIETSTTTFANMSEKNEIKVHKDTNAGGSSGNSCINSQLIEKVNVTNINNIDVEGGRQESFENKTLKDIELFDSSFASSSTSTINVANSKPFMNSDQQPEKEAGETFESESALNSTEDNENLSEADMIESVLDKIKEGINSNTGEMLPKPRDVLNPLKDAEPVVIDEPISKNDESLSMDECIEKNASSENVNIANYDYDDEGMKSPEIASAKVEKYPSSSILKESKRDFTIKYEVNGIVVKENLLTGDKNVVENSSPFRSSAESESNYEQSSQSDLDILVVENNNCFYSKTNTDDMKDISVVSLNADSDQIRKIEEYDVLPCGVTPVLDQNEVCYETDLSCSREVIGEVNLDNGNKTNTEIKSLKEEVIFSKKRDGESIECIVFNSTAQLTKGKETSVVKDIVEENFKLASCVEIEPLPLACINVSRNINDDQSVGSPPVLEKVDTETNCIAELNEDFFSQDLNVCAKVEPPILEPQHLKENDHGIEEQNELKSTQKSRTERHFLDVLGIVDNKMEDMTTIPVFERKQELIFPESDTSEGNTILEKLYSDEKDQDDAIGRHFSDAVSENADVPKTPKSKLQFLLDKSEKGEVTLAQIKDILTPFSKKGKEIFIPNESLLKIKSGIANLLQNVKTPARKDPSWLKRDAFSDYSRDKKLQRSLDYSNEEKGEGDTFREESCSDQEDIDYVSNDTLVPSKEKVSQEDIETDVNTPSGHSVADTILQMLTSLEDKGSIADNMSNLLDILAENLGFLGKGSVDKEGYESSSDSDYQISQNGETMSLSDSDSTKMTQKDLIANYLVEGDEPPSLDEIPTAGTRDVCWSKHFLSSSNPIKKGNFENEDNTDLSECSLSESGIHEFNLKKTKDNIELDRIEPEPCRTYTRKEDSNEKLSEPTYLIKKKFNDADICVDLPEQEEKRPRFEDDSNSFLSFSESCVTNDEAKDQKGKASTIFKSITELNSIETDEESNSGDSFDPVSMSVRLSELKALAKENTTWEFNSDFDSDQNDSDKFESDFENEAESLLESVSKDDSTTQLKKDDVENSLTNRSCCKLERSLSVDNESSEKFEKSDSQEERLINETRTQSVESSFVQKIDADETELCFETKETLLVLSDKNIFQSSSSRIYNNNLEFEEDAQKCKSPSEKIRLELEKESVLKGEECIASPQVPLSSVLRPVATIENSFSENKHSTNDSSQITLSSYTKPTDDIFCNEISVNALSETTFQKNSNTPSETNKKNVYLHDKIIKNGDIILVNDLNCTQLKPIVNSKEISCKCDSIKENKNIAQLEEKSRGKYEVYDTEETNHSYIDDLESKADTRIDEDNDEGNSKLNMLHLHSSMETMGEKIAGRSSDFYPQLHHKNENYDENINENDTLNCEKAVCADDEDTTETVAYNDDLVESKTDFNGFLKDFDITEDSAADKLDDKFLQIENDKNIPTLGKRSQESNSQIKTSRSLATDRKENDNRTMTAPVNFIDLEKYESNCLDLQHAKLEENEKNFTRERHETKLRSTSFNIDSSDISESFCETIAEKVKRNQRDRSKSVCYNFNPWLYYSAAYVREVTKPTKKEISIFRSSILEKRAREKSDSREKDDEVCTPRKKRNSSVPKDHDLSYQKGQPGRCVSLKNKTFVPKQPFHIKPCTVLIPKLTEKMIERFTSRKRKSEEEPPSENRPPIKVTIKLSQIVYPPNSPYGSTSVSSDACRSGYESCSEESESDTNQQDCELNADCSDQRNANSDIKFSIESSEQGNGIDNTEVDLSFREPIKIKMRTLLTKMNNSEEKAHQKFIQNSDQSEQLSVSLNESSSDTNIDGCSRELIESEVLHDIKKECEKVRSRDKDVLFYLSDSESEITPNVRKKEKRDQNKENKEIYDLGVNFMPKPSVSAICGESDVDLSDSDTDTDIQMQIDKILNTKSIENLSQDTTEDESSMKEDGKTVVMNMIVSDLRLSESESESETDTLKKSKDNFHRKEIFKNSFDTEFDMNNSPKSSEEPFSEKSGQTSYKLPQTGIHNKEIIRFSYPGLSKLTKKTEKSAVTNLGTEKNKEFHTEQYKDVKSLKQKYNPIYTSGVEKEQEAIEGLDLSETTQEHQNESSFSQTDFSKSSKNEDLKIYQDAITNTENTSVKFKQFHSSETVGQACIIKNGVCICDKSQCDKSKHTHIASLNECASHVDSETSVPLTIDNLFIEFEEEKQTKDKLRHTCPFPGVRKVVENMSIDTGDGIPEYENKVSEENKTVLKGLTCILDVAPIQTEQIKKTNIIENQDVSKHALTLEERKDLESAKAVQNLEEDTFQNFQHAQDSTSEDMIYYAVELCDDPETNEAVVNLESVELIERPIIIENNDTHEENILDTRIVQSHVDDQIEIQSEPLNEQIIETVDSKHNTELKINDALESITHIDSPVYCPVINDVKSKYLYGINEDSQSSIEVVEELVTDSIVNENVVLQQSEHHVNSEKVQIFSEGTSVEGLNEKLPDILNSIDKHDTNKETVISNRNTESCVDFNGTSVDLSSSFVGCKMYDEVSNPIFQMENRPCLNISENLDTKKMCSGDERVTDQRFGELTGTCDLERTRISSESNSFLQSYGMAVECNDGNDFIITQNELFDEDNVMDTT